MAQAADDAGGVSQGALAAIGLAVLIGMIGTLVFFVMRMGDEEDKKAAPKAPAKKRDALSRMQKGAAKATSVAEEDAGDESEGEEDDGRDARRNAQKDAKKQEKKAAQDAQRQNRQDKDSAKTEKSGKYNEKQKNKEEERKRLEEEETKAREEKEKQEAEEFDKWKEMFAVDAEGEDDGNKEENAVEKFIDYIKLRKVVTLEDLAAEFKMRTSAAIDRIKQLEKLDRISGIFDDRGKFVYISTEEMIAVSSWLKKKGRINRSDLVASCNKLIRLNPTEDDKKLLDQQACSAANLLEEDGGEGSAAAA